MIASASVTLAGFYWLTWYRNRTVWAYLFFALTALCTAAFTFCELQLIRVETVAELLAALRWGHVALFCWLVSITWFVRFYFAAGRLWLAWTICALRALYLLLNFLLVPNVNFREVTALEHSWFLGESLTVFDGLPSPWMLFGDLSLLLLLIFVADAGVTAWRRGEGRKAVMVAASVEFFLLSGAIEGYLVFWERGLALIVFSPLFLLVLVVMAYELSRDLLRASQLVSELHTTKAGLHESEERLSLAVDAADFGICQYELGENEIWASEKWRQLFGFTLSEHLQFSAILQRLHPDDREALRQVHAHAITGTDGGRYQAEYRLLLPDGACRWISAQGRVECDANLQPVVIRDACRDISARKRVEQETQLLRQEIAHAGRVSMLGQLAAALAHEINQPLASILRNAEAAQLFLESPVPDLEEIRGILVDIRKDDERAGGVIERIRGLLKRDTLDMRHLDVSSLVRDVIALVRVDAAMRQVRLDLDVTPDLPRVRADRIQLQQVLLNLVLNGMDALNGASREGRRITVAARLDGARFVEIAVGDAGVGIQVEKLAQIFEPFFTTKPNGMGMGLAISRTIVEAHGGQLWAENRNSGGAVFRFTLPLAEERSAE